MLCNGSMDHGETVSRGVGQLVRLEVYGQPDKVSGTI